MMKFHYDVMEQNFPGLYNLLYTDTDSFVYNIIHNDIYEWIKNTSLYITDYELLKNIYDIFDLKNTNLTTFEKIKIVNNK